MPNMGTSSYSVLILVETGASQELTGSSNSSLPKMPGEPGNQLPVSISSSCVGGWLLCDHSLTLRS